MRALSSRWLLALCAMTSLSLSSPVHAQSASWSDTFTAQVWAPHVHAGQTRVLVVAAGAEVAAAREVATVIESRLRMLNAQLVMGDEGLGVVTGLDDAAIVARAAALPVERVLIVRVFAGASDATPSAVVVLYAKDNSVVAAFSATRGQAIAAAPPAISAITTTGATTVGAQPSGVDSRAAEAVAEITRHHEQASVDAQKKYDEQYVAFDGLAAVAGSTVVATWSVPYQGRQRQPLIGEGFYNAVGRPDLASAYRGKKGRKTGLTAVGVTGLVVGALMIGYGAQQAASAANDCVASADPSCENTPDRTLLYVGGGLMIGGAVMWLAATTINPHPIDGAEARRIAEQHNQRLRQSLGLPALAVNVPQATRVRLSWTPYVSTSAGGLMLRLEM